jgi:UPF0288 family protein (methanogenesis marker protein 3)
MTGSQQRTTIEEIKKLIEEENIEIEAALRLTLASQLIVTEELGEIKTHALKTGKSVDGQIDEIETKLNEIERYLERYPSMSWYWKHRRKMLLLLIFGIMVTYTVLFGWINISDIRQAVLSQLGLPPDLGITP